MAKTHERRFALCISNEGYPASLEVRKVYFVLPDAASELYGLLRVVDESGEDYLYPRGFFVSIELPAAAEQAFATA